MEEDGECTVCCEKYNKTSHRHVTCAHCGYEACRLCVQKFITSPDSARDPSCMKCGHVWHSEFVIQAVTKTFITGPYRLHREKVLFDRETSLMPFTQRTIEAGRDIINLDKKMDSLRLEVERLKRRRRLLIRLDGGHDDAAVVAEDQAGPSSGAKKSTIVLACPADGCKGFITSERWMCGVCETSVCKECREIKSLVKAEHVCDPGNVETAKLLKTDTKPCPTCASLTFKISGCDQMWCVTCHTAYSWMTGVVVDPLREQVHNPEYYRFLREVHNGDIPVNAGMPLTRCRNNGPTAEALMIAMCDIQHRPDSLPKARIMMIHRELNHLRSVTIPQKYELEPANMTPERRNLDLRKKFMTGEIDEQSYRTLLRTRENRRHRTNDFRQLADTFVQISVDTLNTLKPDMTPADASAMAAQLEAVRVLANSAMMSMGQRHNCSYMNIAYSWNA